MSQQNKELDELFEQAVDEWVAQGRDPEHVYAIRNFMTGRGLKLKAAIEVLIDRAVIDKLYSLITPIWGDKNWDEDDKYVLNLKGSDILKHIKELEANLKSKGSE